MGRACELCQPGFYGKNCTKCECSQHGSCSDGISGDGQCVCDFPYEGHDCSVVCCLQKFKKHT